MSLKIRSVLVLVIGTVLGLTVSISSSMLAGRQARSVESFDVIEDESLALIAEALDRVRDEYVDVVDEETLVENAIRGMLGGLDQHSRFLDTDQYQDIRIATTGNYSGVGLDVDLRDGKVTVLSPVEGTPAAKAGIMAGDVVVSIDDIPVGEDGLEAAVSRMRGRPGTPVRLDVSRASNDDVLQFSLTRESIHVNTVHSEYLLGGYGYIRLSGFSNSTVDELDAAASSLTRDGERELNGLVLDLRDNPGGVLESAIGVADRFLADGLIVSGEGRIRQARFEQYAEAGHAFESIPLVVLINRGSASGSEIVAGALRDHHRGLLYGQTSYGKGSVQSVVPLGTGNALKLTTAHYLTPSGARINGRGIDPDVPVPSGDPRRQYRGSDGLVPVDEDQQLRTALQSLGYEAISLTRAR
jgi:carboxyl-terminal processing protease